MFQQNGTGMDQFHELQQASLGQDKKNINVQNFSLLSVIGKGAQAKVIQVRKKDDNKVYAMKVLKKSTFDRVSSERKILETCSHPFIVKLEYAFQNEKNQYFCLEYCPGGELYNLLDQEQKLNEEQTKFYAAQIILAIEYLHSKDIIYRDLKPENILIDIDGYIKLTDFGYSKQGVSGNVGAHTKCGTAQYLAPELLAGDHGKAADWWALGALLYEMVAGEPAFHGDTKEELFDLISKAQVNLKKLPVSKTMKELLQQLLEKDPNIRLGASGASDIRQHKWFKSIVWGDIIEKNVEAFFIPKLVGDDDVSYFSELVDRLDIFGAVKGTIQFKLDGGLKKGFVLYAIGSLGIISTFIFYLTLIFENSGGIYQASAYKNSKMFQELELAYGKPEKLIFQNHALNNNQLCLKVKDNFNNDCIRFELMTRKEITFENLIKFNICENDDQCRMKCQQFGGKAINQSCTSRYYLKNICLKEQQDKLTTCEDHYDFVRNEVGITIEKNPHPDSSFIMLIVAGLCMVAFSTLLLMIKFSKPQPVEIEMQTVPRQVAIPLNY